MARFYSQAGQVQTVIPKKDGSGVRPVHIGDAKKNSWYASVTTICGLLNDGDGLMNWKIDQYLNAAEGLGEALQRGNFDNWKAAVKHKAEDKMKAAPQLGSDVHSVEEYLKHLVNPSYAPAKPEKNIKPYMVAVHQFVTAMNIKPLGEHPIEQVIVNTDARTAGRLDFRGTIDGKGPVYFDWKTQKVRGGNPNFYFKFPLQLSAYWKGDNFTYASVVLHEAELCSVVIDTSRHGTYNTTDNLPPVYHNRYTNPALYYEYFKMLSRLYYAQNDWDYMDEVASAA